MGRTVMIEDAEEIASGVVCLRCGTRTHLPASGIRNLSRAASDPPRFPLHIVRCEGCGKEGSYLACEIIEFKTKPACFSTAA